MPYDSGNYLTATGYGVQGLASIGNGYAQYTALKAQGDFQVAMAQINQQFAGIEAKDAVDRGEFEANQIRRRATHVVGDQRAAAAAQGIDVNDSQGSVSDVIADTQLASEQDMTRARSNAWKLAWGIKTQATLNVDTARFNQTGKNFEANQSLLTGGINAMGDALKVAGVFAKTKTPPGPTVPSSPSVSRAPASSPSVSSGSAPSGSGGGMAWFPDDPKDGDSGKPGFYGHGPRSEYGNGNWWESNEEAV